MDSGNDPISDLERHALECATFASTVQAWLHAVSGFFAAAGLGLLSVSLVSLAGPEVVRAFAPQVAVGLTILLWVPLSIFLPRLFGTRHAVNRKEFRRFLERSSGVFAVPSRSTGELVESLARLKTINDNDGEHWRVVAAFARRQLNLAIPLAAVGLSLAGICIYSSAVAGAGLAATLRLLVMPLVAIVSLGLIVALTAWFSETDPKGERQ